MRQPASPGRPHPRATASPSRARAALAIDCQGTVPMHHGLRVDRATRGGGEAIVLRADQPRPPPGGKRLPNWQHSVENSKNSRAACGGVESPTTIWPCTATAPKKKKRKRQNQKGPRFQGEQALAARKPRSLTINAGCPRLRMAARQMPGSSMNDPPRNTRDLSSTGETVRMFMF